MLTQSSAAAYPVISDSSFTHMIHHWFLTFQIPDFLMEDYLLSDPVRRSMFLKAVKVLSNAIS